MLYFKIPVIDTTIKHSKYISAIGTLIFCFERFSEMLCLITPMTFGQFRTETKNVK